MFQLCIPQYKPYFRSMLQDEQQVSFLTLEMACRMLYLCMKDSPFPAVFGELMWPVETLRSICRPSCAKVAASSIRAQRRKLSKQIKEKTSYVALDPKKEEKEWLSAGTRGGESKVLMYDLPDGQKLKVGPERFRAPEILFDPELIGLEWPGLHQIVVDAINRTDMDLRKALFGNIVISGGSTMTKGFGDRLLHEVQRLAVKDMRIKIFAPPERLYSTWIGGSILAGLSTFRKMYVTIDDWHESTSYSQIFSSVR